MPDTLDHVLEHLDPNPLTTGHGFTEGPVWHPDRYFLFTTVPYVYRLDVDTGHLTVLRDSPAGSNGMTLDLGGRLVMCDGEHRSVTRMDPDGAIVPVAASCEGRPLNKPNDVVFRSDGTMYFTDPGAWPNHTPRRAPLRKLRLRRDSRRQGVRGGPLRVPQRPRLLPRRKIRSTSPTPDTTSTSAPTTCSPTALSPIAASSPSFPKTASPASPTASKSTCMAEPTAPAPAASLCTGPDGHYIGKIRLPELPANLGMGRP